MKKFFILIVALCWGLSTQAETEFTFTAAADMNQTKDGISVVIAKGSGNAPSATKDYETQKPEIRLYVGNTITLTSETALTNIQLVFAKSSASNKEYAGLSASTGELVSGGTSESKKDWKVDSWTGEATNIVFTLTGKGQRQIQRILIDGAPIQIDSVQPQPLPRAEDLNESYVYAEPTVVLVPDTQFFKAEYAFIENNILVYCSLGSIIYATDTTEAYFNCNENQDLVFTATQPIQRIEIDGYLRKAFTATCDHGQMETKASADYEVTDTKVLTIHSIGEKSVTIHCNKQLRCFEVRFYFTEEQGIDETNQEPTAKSQKLNEAYRING